MKVASVKHRSAAIQRSEHPLADLNGPAMVRSLRGALDGPWWKETAPDRGSNWIWRDAVPSHKTLSKEVVLERSLAASSPEHWTCQMSTCSGLRPARTDARRAIDLVQRLDVDRYRFIELKVGSDQPLYAAFEVLGYGLLYLLAREHQRHGSGRYDVMTATHVQLTVLGPTPWYNYKVSRNAGTSRFDLGWLASAINDGLASELSSRATESVGTLAAISLDFRRFDETEDVGGDCQAICRELC